MTRVDEPTVAIHAQLLPGSAGGIETNLLSLLRALNRRAESGRQVVIGPGGESHWLQPVLGPRQSILSWPPIRYRSSPPARPLLSRLRDAARRGVRAPLPTAAGLRAWLRRRESNGEDEGERITRTLADMGVELVHFPYQRHFPTHLPFIFEPWDLQHRHFPEFFAPEEIDFRERIYRVGCERAALVVTASYATKRDLVQHFGLASDKVAVIRRGVFTREERRMSRPEATHRLRALGLPDRFALYPAKTWPHKNHPRLFRALARLRDKEGVSIPLVCTGKPVDDYQLEIRKSLEASSLERLIFFTGHLDADRMAALFRRAELLVFPSLFEGLAIPLLEAMHFETPIVASHAPCLPEMAGEAAVYCDPLSVDSIADAILKVWMSPELREACRVRGAARITMFDWDDAGRKFLVCYRLVGGRRLDAEDTRIVAQITQSDETAVGLTRGEVG